MGAKGLMMPFVSEGLPVMSKPRIKLLMLKLLKRINVGTDKKMSDKKSEHLSSVLVPEWGLIQY